MFFEGYSQKAWFYHEDHGGAPHFQIHRRNILHCGKSADTPPSANLSFMDLVGQTAPLLGNVHVCITCEVWGVESCCRALTLHEMTWNRIGWPELYFRPVGNPSAISANIQWTIQRLQFDQWSRVSFPYLCWLVCWKVSREWWLTGSFYPFVFCHESELYALFYQGNTNRKKQSWYIIAIMPYCLTSPWWSPLFGDNFNRWAKKSWASSQVQAGLHPSSFVQRSDAARSVVNHLICHKPGKRGIRS